eukprot:GILI01003701.1.p1 GENE.GILI01003701.1~~GILI01003701.1.p1  ORF type:complete len:490 (-),score=178.72 GILI01003701.1:255-1679(-)
MSEDIKVTRTNFVPSFHSRITDDYDFVKELGSGTYGTVRLAVHKHNKPNNKPVKRAVKEILKSSLSPSAVQRLITEIDILKSIDHPNIIKLFETYEDNQKIYLVMEVCSGGELFDRIIAKGNFTEREAADLMKQLLSAILYCHQHNICHRDLKPENFIFQTSEPDSPVKIIDFGLSKIFDAKTIMQTRAGTPYYVAPDVLRGRYDKSCDMWSLGVIMYILLCGYPPFYGDNDNQIMDRVRIGRYSMDGPEWQNVSAEAKDLIAHLLSVDASRRYTAEQALAHPWLAHMSASVHADSSLSLTSINSLRNFRAHEKLKRAALMVIASQLTQDEIGELRKVFLSLDKNNDGILTVAELQEGLATLGQSTVLDEVQRIMAGVDADGSGSIDYTEFLAATIEKHVYLQEEKLHAAFRMFDKDGSGKITAAELKAVLCGDGSNFDQLLFQDMIREVDKNGDGEIDYREFCEMMERSTGRV